MHSNIASSEFASAGLNEYDHIVNVPIWKPYLGPMQAMEIDTTAAVIPVKMSTRIKSFFLLKNPGTSLKFCKNFGSIFHQTVTAIGLYLAEISENSVMLSPSDTIPNNPLLLQITRPFSTVAALGFIGKRNTIESFQPPYEMSKISGVKKHVFINIDDIGSDFNTTFSVGASKRITDRIHQELYNAIIDQTTPITYIGPKPLKNIVYMSSAEFITIIGQSNTILLPTQAVNFLLVVANIIINRLVVKTVELTQFSKRITVTEDHVFSALEYIIEDEKVKERIFEHIRNLRQH